MIIFIKMIISVSIIIIVVMAEDLGPGLAKRTKQGKEGGSERGILLESLMKLSGAIDETVRKAREEYDSLGPEKFVTAPRSRGIRNMWSHVGSYVGCLRGNGVSTYSQLEALWKRHYGDSEVREAVEALLESEDASHRFIDDVDKSFRAVDAGRRVEKKTAAGDSLLPNLSVVDGRSGEEARLEEYWKGSKVTLFVLLRHFG